MPASPDKKTPPQQPAEKLANTELRPAAPIPAGDVGTATPPPPSPPKGGRPVGETQLYNEILASKAQRLATGEGSPSEREARARLAGVAGQASASAAAASASSGGRGLLAGIQAGSAGGQQEVASARAAQFSEQAKRTEALAQLILAQKQADMQNRIAEEERRLGKYLLHQNEIRYGIQGAYAIGTLGIQLGNELASYGGGSSGSSGSSGSGGATETQYGDTVTSYSDRRAKTDIKKADDDEITEFMRALKGYTYKYNKKAADNGAAPGKNGEFGIMVQDMEKTKLGKKLVEEVRVFNMTKKGPKPAGEYKAIRHTALGAALAAIGNLNKRLEALESSSDSSDAEEGY
jgi:hypothetical protein